MEEQLYIKGFNSGYLVAKHRPEMWKKMQTSLQPTSDFLQGLFSGSEEYVLEVSQEHLNDLKFMRDHSKDLEHDMEL